MLASSCVDSFRRSDGGNRASAHRGERVISRKAIAQGMSDVLRCPVCSCAAFLALFAHEIAGAARIRHSLRPLSIEGETKAIARAFRAARMRIHIVVENI